MLNDCLAFAGVMLLGQFSPGPDMLLLLKNAMNHPLRAGLWTVTGIATGLVLHTTLALTGLAIVLQQSDTARRAIGIAGGLYLGWLACKLLHSVFAPPGPAAPGMDDCRRGEKPLADRSAFLQGFLTNILNPKAVIFLVSVMAAMLGKDPPFAKKLAFWGIVVGQAFVFWSLFVWLLKRPPLGALYRRSERVLNLLFGVALLAVAVSAVMDWH